MGQSFNVEGVLSLQDKGFSNTLKNAANSLNGFGKNAGSSFDGANRSMDGLSQKADQARSSILNIAAGIGAMQLVGKAVDMVKNSVSGAISRFDTLNQYPKVMEQLGYSAKDVSKSMDTLQNGIKGLPTALDDVVSTTQQFASITGDVDTAAKTTIALNDAFLASGSSAADAARGLQQYTQMLSSGKVDLMSWRTLQETMPSTLKKVAEAFGYAGRSATNDLYAALQDGTITMDQLNQKFQELDGGVNGFANQARTASTGIQTSFDNLQTAVTRGMANMLTAIDSGLTSNGFPTMAASINKGQDLIDAGFKKLNGSIPGMITNFKNFGGSLAPLSGLLTAVSTGVMGLMAFSTVAPQINATFIALKNVGSAFSVILSPIGLIAAGIALLAVAFYKAYTTSEPFRNAIDNIAKTIHGGFDSAIQGVAKALERMGVQVGSTTGIFQQLSQALDTPKGQMVAFAGGAALLVAGLMGLISPVGLLKGLFGGLGSIFTGLLPNFSGTAKAAEALGTATESAGTRASASGSLFSGFSGAVLKVGTAIGVASAGLGIFAFGIAAIAKQGDAGMVAVMALAVGISMIVAVLAVAAPMFTANSAGMNALGNTALKLGASIAIASAGVSLFVMSITALAQTGTAGVVAVVAVTVAIAALVAVFALLGPRLTASVVGIVGFGAAVALIGVGIGAASAGLAMLISAFTQLTMVSSLIVPTFMQIGLGFTTMMTTILNGLMVNIPLILQAFTTMATGILMAIITLAPLVGQAMIAVGQAILNALMALIPQVLLLIGMCITQVLALLVALTPTIVASIAQILIEVLTTLAAYVPQIVAAVTQLMVSILLAIGDNAPQIIAAFLLMCLKLLKAVVEIAPQVAQVIAALMVELVAIINSYMGAFRQIGGLLLKSLAAGLIGKKIDVTGKAKEIMEDAGKNAKDVGEKAFDVAGGNSAMKNINALANKQSETKSTGGKLGTAAAKGMDSKKSEAKTAGKNIGNAGKSGANSTKGSWRSVGTQLAAGLAAGIRAGRSDAVNAARQIAQDAVNAAKAAAKIHSPSRVMRNEVGKYMALGMAVGIDDFGGSVQKASARLAENAIPDVKTNKIAGVINNANSRLQSGLSATIDQELTLGTQPAYINLSMGGSTFSGFTDDITKQQDIDIQQRFGRGFN